MSVSDVKKDKLVTIAFIADDIGQFSEFEFNHNSTFALMLAAQEVGAKILFAKSSKLKVFNNKICALFEEVIPKKKYPNYIEIVRACELSLDSVDVLFARKDPPINESYFSYIQLLYLGSQSTNTLVVNNPLGIMKANEKLYPLNFPNLIPKTIVTSNIEEVLNFLEEHGEAVIKPLFAKGGEGVFYLNKNSKNNNSILESFVSSSNKTIIVQKYIPEVINGDKRIVLLNGEPLGGIYRVPDVRDFRASVRHGAKIKPCDLSKRDLEICQTLKPHLIKEGLYFASIDLIGDYLIEINVTCPASLQEVERATGRKAAREIVEWSVSHCLQKICL